MIVDVFQSSGVPPIRKKNPGIYRNPKKHKKKTDKYYYLPVFGIVE
jgi:hypothetical protein